MLLSHHKEDIKGIFARRANPIVFNVNFCKKTTELEKAWQHFQVVIHFHPDHLWLMTLSY